MLATNDRGGLGTGGNEEEGDRKVPLPGIHVYLELIVGPVSPPTALGAPTDSCTVGSVAPAGVAG